MLWICTKVHKVGGFTPNRIPIHCKMTCTYKYTPGAIYYREPENREQSNVSTRRTCRILHKLTGKATEERLTHEITFFVTWCIIMLKVAFKQYFGINQTKVCQENNPYTITPPPPAWTVNTSQVESMDSYCLCQILTLPSVCLSRNQK